jgi:hypothetical protein
MDRRFFLRGSAAATAAASWATSATAASQVDPFLDDLQARTFRFFWETTNPANGLTPDRYPDPPFCSIAAVGFALTAYPIGVERGWVSRRAARRRVLTTLRFFNEAPQGPAATGVTGYNGFFYHFLDMALGARFETVELSTVDTALLVAGMLFCQSYFDDPAPEEAEIRRLAEAIYSRIDWVWAQQPAEQSPAISMGWKPEADTPPPAEPRPALNPDAQPEEDSPPPAGESPAVSLSGMPEGGFLPYSWRGYNEAMIVYLLALGSPTHPVAPDAWAAWQRDFDMTWGLNGGPLPHLGFGPMFGHQYPHVWIDLRGIRDDYMRGRDLDYFENSRRATLAQQAYAVANPGGWKGYGADIWGLTACDGPGDVVHPYGDAPRQFHSYAARAPGSRDDGTLAPTAALGSIAFAPEICGPGALAMKRDYGARILDRYGFIDAFNPSFDFDDLAPTYGRRIPGAGWVGSQYLGIDQGPIVAMLENWRSGFIWKVMRRNPHIVRGLQRAGFTGGWLDAA